MYKRLICNMVFYCLCHCYKEKSRTLEPGGTTEHANAKVAKAVESHRRCQCFNAQTLRMAGCFSTPTHMEILPDSS